ncbi:MAG: OmpA family protein [Candidatus Omnitrophica bacterium]|nr:OmpA family protein [Candidatus Omnitrophota bacterium]
MKKLLWGGIVGVFIFSGCTFVIQKGRRSDIEKIKELSRNLEELNQVKRILEERLQKEIQDKQVRLEMMEKGLVITFVADILFDSGKASIRPENYSTLDKIANVLAKNIPHNYIGIEGHTDNEPIKYSGWRSNWELSTARALSVLHYLVDEKGLSPDRFSAIGYGEYRPVASNDTKEGRQLNRRVEIVIIPRMTKEKIVKKEDKPSSSASRLIEPPENLK